MRTDTKTFRNNLFAQVRALGINSVRSKSLTRQVISGIVGGAYTSYGEKLSAVRAEIGSLELSINFCFNGSQLLEVYIDKAHAFSVSTPDHVLVNTQATAEQVALRPAFDAARTDVHSAIADACAAWEDQNGSPATLEAAEARYVATNAAPTVAAARAVYEALVARSLAMNPYAHVNHIDPMLFNGYSDDWKDEMGSRPRGYTTYAEVLRYYERSMERHEAANDGDAVAIATAA